MSQTLPFWIWRRGLPIPHRMKIYWWVCVVAFLLAVVWWPLALLALPMWLVFIGWWTVNFVRVRRLARR